MATRIWGPFVNLHSTQVGKKESLNFSVFSNIMGTKDKFFFYAHDLELEKITSGVLNILLVQSTLL